MAAVAGERLARAPAGHSIEPVTSLASAPAFFCCIASNFFAGATSSAWNAARARGCNCRSAAVPLSGIALARSADNALVTRNVVVLWRIVMALVPSVTQWVTVTFNFTRGWMPQPTSTSPAFMNAHDTVTPYRRLSARQQGHRRRSHVARKRFHKLDEIARFLP